VARLVLTGDINLMNVTDHTVPFRRVAPELRSADLVFSNLECCLHTPSRAQSFHTEGFYADPAIATAALREASVAAVGIANNVNYGERPILDSIAHLDAAGIAHTGAGANRAAAHAPAILERGGVRFGFLQRSSVFWATNHEAGAHDPGIAVLPGHTAYQVPQFERPRGMPPMNRPGVAPVIVTWPDAAYLRGFTDEINALRAQVDVVVASCHWGVRGEILGYMRQIAHAAIEAGADIVMGHGPHDALGVEVHRGRPIFYGLGSFSFHTGHGGRAHGDWVGMMVRADVTKDGVQGACFQFVRHDAANETILRPLAEEQAELASVVSRSRARLEPAGDVVTIALHQA
jgi:poly-gamma-glutamate synthesis protein (capsule biosynthesis protein)